MKPLPHLLARVLPTLLVALALVVALGACGQDDQDGASVATPGAEAGHEGHDHDAHEHAEGAHGGGVMVLGDHAAHLEILHDEEHGEVVAYLTDADFEPLTADAPPALNLKTAAGSVRVVAEPAEGGWRFTHEALRGEPEGGRFQIRVGGRTYTPEMEAGHAHGHEQEDAHGDEHGHEARGPSDGVVADLLDEHGARAGTIELKLHDDKGDLELWTTSSTGKPLLLTLEARPVIVFLDRGGKQVDLAVRNRERNEDENGNATIRDGRTNYFVFPGETGVDASWLAGGGFEAEVTVRIVDGDRTLATRPFALVPHTHGADHDH